MCIRDRRGRLPREDAFGIEIDRGGLGGGRRPLVELAPLIHPRLKDVRLGKNAIAAALQVVEEERQFDAFAVIDAGLGAERDVAEPVAIAAREAAVIPVSYTHLRAHETVLDL